MTFWKALATFILSCTSTALVVAGPIDDINDTNNKAQQRWLIKYTFNHYLYVPYAEKVTDAGDGTVVYLNPAVTSISADGTSKAAEGKGYFSTEHNCPFTSVTVHIVQAIDGDKLFVNTKQADGQVEETFYKGEDGVRKHVRRAVSESGTSLVGSEGQEGDFVFLLRPEKLFELPGDMRAKVDESESGTTVSIKLESAVDDMELIFNKAPLALVAKITNGAVGRSEFKVLAQRQVGGLSLPAEAVRTDFDRRNKVVNEVHYKDISYEIMTAEDSLQVMKFEFPPNTEMVESVMKTPRRVDIKQVGNRQEYAQ